MDRQGLRFARRWRRDRVRPVLPRRPRQRGAGREMDPADPPRDDPRQHALQRDRAGSAGHLAVAAAQAADPTRTARRARASRDRPRARVPPDTRRQGPRGGAHVTRRVDGALAVPRAVPAGGGPDHVDVVDAPPRRRRQHSRPARGDPVRLSRRRAGDAVADPGPRRAVGLQQPPWVRRRPARHDRSDLDDARVLGHREPVGGARRRPCRASTACRRWSTASSRGSSGARSRRPFEREAVDAPARRRRTVATTNGDRDD